MVVEVGSDGFKEFVINEVQRLELISLDEVINELDGEGLVEVARDIFFREGRRRKGIVFGFRSRWRRYIEGMRARFFG